MSTETFEPRFVAETLGWCNQIRAEKGLAPVKRLPKGERHSPETCPCGQITGLHVDSTWYTEAGDPTKHRLPGAVEEFVLAFDDGDLPQYDTDPEEVL